MSDFETRMACQEFIIRCLRAIDDRDYDEVASGFVEDGIWSRGGVDLVGTVAVREAMDQRPADFETQHLAINFAVELAGEGSAIVRYTIMGYAQTADKPCHLHAIFRATDHLRLTSAGWRFVHRSAVPAFSALGERAT